MDYIYDNGDKMLGQVRKIKEYNDKLFREENIDEEAWVELAKELVFYNDSDIVSIDYSNGMGISIESWGERDKRGDV
jgi:hypothetical protein